MMVFPIGTRSSISSGMAPTKSKFFASVKTKEVVERVEITAIWSLSERGTLKWFSALFTTKVQNRAHEISVCLVADERLWTNWSHKIAP